MECVRPTIKRFVKIVETWITLGCATSVYELQFQLMFRNLG